MRTINVSQFDCHPHWRVELVVIQYQPYAEGVRLVHLPTGRYILVITDLAGTIHQVIKRGQL
jgi:hypothetical protein